MKSARPIPTGAINVALCFSFASIKIVNTNSAVKIPSINTPLTKLVLLDNVVLTLNSVGNNPNTIPEAATPPASCAKNRKMARGMGSAPTRTIPSVTAGLNRPPEMRKKIQTLTMREKPNIIEM